MVLEFCSNFPISSWPCVPGNGVIVFFRSLCTHEVPDLGGILTSYELLLGKSCLFTPVCQNCELFLSSCSFYSVALSCTTGNKYCFCVLIIGEQMITSLKICLVIRVVMLMKLVLLLVTKFC